MAGTDCKQTQQGAWRMRTEGRYCFYVDLVRVPIAARSCTGNSRALIITSDECARERNQWQLRGKKRKGGKYTFTHCHRLPKNLSEET